MVKQKREILKKGVAKDMKVFMRKSDKGLHFIQAFPSTTRNFWELDLIAMRYRQGDHRRRLVYDRYRITDIHYLPYKAGILFDNKEGSYRGDWDEIDL